MKISHLLLAAFAVAISSPTEALAPPPPTEQFVLADMQAPPYTTPPESLPADARGCTLTIKGERADNGTPIVVRKANFRIAGYCVVTGSLAELSCSDEELSFNGTILVENVEGNSYTGRISGTLECKGANPVEVLPFTFELTVPTK